MNLYPNAAYLMLHGEASIDEERLEAFAAHMRRDIMQVLRESSSILIGPGFTDLAELPRQAARLNQMRASIFEGDQDILFADRLDSDDDKYYAESIETNRKK